MNESPTQGPGRTHFAQWSFLRGFAESTEFVHLLESFFGSMIYLSFVIRVINVEISELQDVIDYFVFKDRGKEP